MLRLWCITLFSVIILGLLKGGVSWAIKLISHARLNEMSDLADTSGNILTPLAVMFRYCLPFGEIAGVLVLDGAPATGGGGIPDIKAFLNGNLLKNFLDFRTLIVRVCGVILVISCGALSGPEGPMAHVGTITPCRTGNCMIL